MSVIQPWAMRPTVDVNPTAIAAPKVTAVGAAPDAIGRQFEQLLVRQLLAQVRSESLSGDEAPSTSAGYLQLADDQLAATIASVGGLGLGASLGRWMKGVAAYQNAP